MLGLMADDGTAPVAAQVRHDGAGSQQDARAHADGIDLAGVGLTVADEIVEHLGGILAAVLAEIGVQGHAVEPGGHLDRGHVRGVGHVDVDHDEASVALDLKGIHAVHVFVGRVDNLHRLAAAAGGQPPGQIAQIRHVGHNVILRRVLAGVSGKRDLIDVVFAGAAFAAVLIDEHVIIVLIFRDDLRPAAVGMADDAIKRHAGGDIAKVVDVDVDVSDLQHPIGEHDVGAADSRDHIFGLRAVKGVFLAIDDLFQHIPARRQLREVEHRHALAVRGDLIDRTVSVGVIRLVIAGAQGILMGRLIVGGDGIEPELNRRLLGLPIGIEPTLGDLHLVDHQVVMGEAIVRADGAGQAGRADVGLHIGGVLGEDLRVQAEIRRVAQGFLQLADGDAVHILGEADHIVDTDLAVCRILGIDDLHALPFADGGGIQIDGFAGLNLADIHRISLAQSVKVETRVHYGE